MHPRYDLLLRPNLSLLSICQSWRHEGFSGREWTVLFNTMHTNSIVCWSKPSNVPSSTRRGTSSVSCTKVSWWIKRVVRAVISCLIAPSIITISTCKSTILTILLARCGNTAPLKCWKGTVPINVIDVKDDDEHYARRYYEIYHKYWPSPVFDSKSISRPTGNDKKWPRSLCFLLFWIWMCLRRARKVLLLSLTQVTHPLVHLITHPHIHLIAHHTLSFTFQHPIPFTL